MGSFSMVMYLHNVMHVSEGMGFHVKVFREAGTMAVASEGFFVF